jgi:hypothetical protein
MFRKDPVKERQNRQYIDDLVTITGVNCGSGFVEKFAFYSGVIMNGVLYDPEKAHMLAEEIRESNRRRESEIALIVKEQLSL